MNILDFKRKSLGHTFREGGDQFNYPSTAGTATDYSQPGWSYQGHDTGWVFDPRVAARAQAASAAPAVVAVNGPSAGQSLGAVISTTGGGGPNVDVPISASVEAYESVNPDGTINRYDTQGNFVTTYRPNGSDIVGDFFAGLDSSLGLSKGLTAISGGLADLDKDLKLSENAPAILALAAAVVGAPYLSELVASVGAEAAAAQMVSAGVVSAEAAAGAGLAAGELGLAGGTALGAGNLGVASAMGGAAGAGTLNALGAGGAAGANALGTGLYDAGLGNILSTTVAPTVGQGAVLAPAATAGTGAMGAGLGGAATTAAGEILGAGTAAAGANALTSGAAGAGNALTNYLTSPAGIQTGASLAGGVISAAGANAAANTQADAADRALTLQREIYDSQKALQEPYRAAGITAQNRLLDYLGLSANTGQADYGKYARDFGMADFQADPGYAFRLSEGQKSLDRQAAARGGLISGGALKAATRYGQEAGSQEYGNAYNRYQTNRTNQLQPLGNLMASGQSAASNVGSAAGQYGTNAANLINQGGQATAAGQLGIGNTINNAIGAGVSAYQNNNLLEMLRRQNTSSYANPYAQG